MKEHRMFLLSADLREVHGRLAVKFNASLVEQEQHRTRNADDGVRGSDDAPDEEDVA